MPHRYRFDGFEVRSLERVILKDGRRLAVGARGFDLLLALIERRDKLVTKTELLDAVWPGLVVEESNVQVQVSGLRKLLGPTVIATIPGLGYRFAAALWSDAAAPGTAQRPEHVPDRRARARQLRNLPGTVEELIGREADVLILQEWLARSRLVSVVGPGGIGKTRVAHEVARRQAGLHEHGVCWIDLVSISQPAQVATAVANGVELDLGLGDDSMQGLLRALESRELLLVLDNCEHLVDAVGRFAVAVQQCAPRVRLLVTSQELLKTVGERAYRLEPLALPQPDLDFGTARAASACRLLEQRVQAVERRFELTPANLAPAIALVRHLDGIPLAIEMAAARVPLFGLEPLVDRLGQRFELLRSTCRNPLARHQTLRATLEWSYSLLDGRAQALMRRLSPFVGSFRVETAQRALADSEVDEWVVLDEFSSLIDKSLVQVESADPPRYRLLETMRLFCAEQLSSCGDALLAEQRHGSAMAELAAQVEEAYWSLSDAAWLARHASDYDELQATFDRACVRRDVDVAALAGNALMRLDHLRSLHTPRSQRAEALFGLLPIASPVARAWIWNCIASHGLITINAVSRLEAADQAVQAWRTQSDPMRLHFALGFHAAECSRVRDFSAANRLIAEARSLERPGWPVRRLMWGAAAAAGVCSHQNDANGYRAASRLELALAERLGADRAAAWARLKLADAALMAGDSAEAVELGEAGVLELRRLDQPANLGLALSNLCAALLLSHQTARARETAVEALPLMWHNGWSYLLLDSIALLAARNARPLEAAQLLGSVDAWYAHHQDGRQPNEAALERTASAEVSAALGEAEHRARRAEGKGLADSDVQRLAVAVLRSAP